MLLNPSLQLPEENEFIPTDFSIRERPQDVSTVKYSILYMSFALEQYLKQLVFRLCENEGLQTVYIFSFNDFFVNICPFNILSNGQVS